MQTRGHDLLRIRTHTLLEKFSSVINVKENRPFAKIDIWDNQFLEAGLDLLWTLVCDGGVLFSNANARIGVGDSTTPEDPTQTGLLGANQLFKEMDVGFPTFGTAQLARFRATFGFAEGNFDWQEWVVDNGVPVTLNRRVQAIGVKDSTEIRRLTVTFFAQNFPQLSQIQASATMLVS